MIYFDIEADGLLYEATKIWCLVAYDDAEEKYFIYHVDTEEKLDYPKNSIIIDNIYNLLSTLSNNNLVTFNGISYDLPLLTKLHNFKYSLNNQIDCHIDSRLQYPDREGHSLGYYGTLLGYPKGEHNDWSCFSGDMLTYCIRDVDLLVKVNKHLQKEAGDWDWTAARKLEYKVADIQVRQEMKGVLFDVDSASILDSRITNELAEIESKILAEIPLKAVQVGATVDKPFKKDGKLSENVRKWILEAHSVK